jgi:hypothetical protein
VIVEYHPDGPRILRSFGDHFKLERFEVREIYSESVNNNARVSLKREYTRSMRKGVYRKQLDLKTLVPTRWFRCRTHHIKK